MTEPPPERPVRTAVIAGTMGIPIAPNLSVYDQPIERNGRRTRTRTVDPLIKSQLLYQLSYAP